MSNSIASQLDWAVRAIASDTPRLDAEILLTKVLNKNRSFLFAWPQFQLSDEQCCEFAELVGRRQSGVPIAYLLGEQEFWSLDFLVNSSTLIPRPETEQLIDAVLADCDRSAALTVLDAGTGSGAIAVVLAKECPRWCVLACDYSEGALKVAGVNSVRHNVSVRLFRGDWLQAVANNALDVIVSNPPYIAAADSHLPALRYEPHSALVADNEGYADIITLASQAYAKLQVAGRFYVEHGYQQGEKVRSILSAAGFENIATAEDYAGLERFTYGVKKRDE